jgi:branched-chain amino acid transport system substrate-binding protein
MHDPQLIQTAGTAAEGLVFPYPKEPTGEQAKDFKANFRKKYGKDPGITSDVGYDAAKMIAAAIEKVGHSTGEDIRKGLTLLVDYQGASGVMTFDKNGDVHKPMGMMVVRSGEFRWEDQ